MNDWLGRVEALHQTGLIPDWLIMLVTVFGWILVALILSGVVE